MTMHTSIFGRSDVARNAQERQLAKFNTTELLRETHAS